MFQKIKYVEEHILRGIQLLLLKVRLLSTRSLKDKTSLSMKGQNIDEKFICSLVIFQSWRVLLNQGWPLQ